MTREDRVRVNVVVVVNFLVCFVGISATSSQLLQRQLRASQSDPENDKIQQLVLQLGSTDYQNRLRAERELLKLGIQAVEPIRQCIDPVAGVLDLEIQLRGRRVLAEIMKSDFESRVTRFLADDDATEAKYGLFGWDQFAAIAGCEDSSRQLFVRIYRGQQPLFLMARSGFESLQRGFERDWTQQMRNAGSVARAIDLLNGFLFLSLYKFGDQAATIDVDQKIVDAILARLVTPATIAFVRSSRHRRQIESVISRWLQERVGGRLSWIDQRVLIADRYDLQSQLPFLLESVSDDQLPLTIRFQSLEVVSRIGGRECVLGLEPALDEERRVNNMVTGLSSAFTSMQFRDLVLAVSLRLSSIEPTRFGFLENSARKSGELGHHLFKDDSARQSALIKWSEYLSSLPNPQSLKSSLPGGTKSGSDRD